MWEDAVDVQHTIRHVPYACHKVGHFTKVCHSRLAQQQAGGSQQQPNARTIHIWSQQLSQKQCLQLYTVHERVTEPAPTIAVKISSFMGTCSLDVLPDPGADICAAGQEVLEYLGQHINNIIPSGTY